MHIRCGVQVIAVCVCCGGVFGGIRDDCKRCGMISDIYQTDMHTYFINLTSISRRTTLEWVNVERI